MRVSEANRNDETVLSEYLPEDVNDILAEPIVGPDDVFDPGEDFVACLTEVALTRVDPPLPAPIVFTMPQEALDANNEILRRYDYDFPKMTLGYGSESRPIHQLKKVLGGHPSSTY